MKQVSSKSQPLRGGKGSGRRRSTNPPKSNSSIRSRHPKRGGCPVAHIVL